MFRKECNISEGDVQCPYVYGTSCCGFVNDHDGNHGTHSDNLSHNDVQYRWKLSQKYVRMLNIKKDIGEVIFGWEKGNDIMDELEKNVFSQWGEY